MGVYNQIKTDIVFILVIYSVFLFGGQAIYSIFNIGYDDTDSEEYGRSGMSLRVDHGTGCQYLESSSGYLTPRLDYDGRVMCGVPQ